MVTSIVGLFLLVLGGTTAIRPDLMVRFQVWTQRVVMGSQLIPSERTHTVNRGFGVFLALMGLLLITGILR